MKKATLIDYYREYSEETVLQAIAYYNRNHDLESENRYKFDWELFGNIPAASASASGCAGGPGIRGGEAGNLDFGRRAGAVSHGRMPAGIIRGPMPAAGGARRVSAGAIRLKIRGRCFQ